MPHSVGRAALAALFLCAALTFVSVALAQSPGAESTQPPTATPTPSITPTPQETAAAEAKRRAELRAQARKARSLRRWIKRHREITWYWQDVMQKPHVRRPYARAVSVNLHYLKKVARVWKKRALRARYKAHHPPHNWQWNCIQSGILNGYRVGSGEGSWNSNSNPKYKGGLQMDVAFMVMYNSRLYRLKGPANNWTPWEQKWTGERALRAGRGFRPWPRTARACGLI